MEAKQKLLNSISNFADINGDHITLLKIYKSFTDVARFGLQHDDSSYDYNMIIFYMIIISFDLIEYFM